MTYMIERASHQFSLLNVLVVFLRHALDFFLELIDRTVPVFDQGVFLLRILFHRLDPASQLRDERILNVYLLFEGGHLRLGG